MLLRMLVGIGVALLVAWVALVLAMVVARPKGQLLKEALRLLPDVLRLLRRLAADRSLPGGVRVRLWLLLGYLAIPVDLVPDFVPVLGYADDAIIVTWVLRSVVRRAGADAVRRHWPGSQDGLDAVWRHAGLGPPALTGDPCA
jgi:uncharacterized membrane protein YkvA (DUF1232 family)